MPLDRTLQFCVYGDSHIACIKNAVDEDRVDLTGVDLEFWGAAGPRFRDLHFVDGRITPTSPEAERYLEVINPEGRKELSPTDFEAYLFMGCRLRASEFLVPILRGHSDATAFVSSAVRATMLFRWLEGCRSYRVAREFAKNRPVLFAPAGFLNDRLIKEDEVQATINTGATLEQRAELWREVERAMAQDGVTLLAQPEETVIRGALTHFDYAAKPEAVDGDTVHKNGAYGALILNAAIAGAKAARITA